MAVIDEFVSILGYEIRGQENLARFTAGMERVKTTVGAAAAAIGRYASLATAAAVVGTGAFANSVISTGAEFEKLETTLATIEGSSEKAKESLAWVQQFAETTPYDLRQVSEAFVRMRAYGLTPMDGSLRAIGDAASAMGYDLMAGVEAVADAATGENERLKAFGITASVAGDEVTYSWKQNGQDMTRTLKKNGSEITGFLVEWFGRYAGAMDDQAKTWYGLVGKMGDEWEVFKKKIDDAGFFAWAKRNLDSLLQSVDALDANGTLDKWAKSISDKLILVGDAAARFGRYTWRAASALAEFYRHISGGALNPSTWQALAGALAMAVRVLVPWVFWTGLAVIALDDLFAYMDGVDSRIGAFVAKIRELTGVSKEIAESLTGIGAAIAVGLLANIGRIARGAVGLLGRGLMAGIAAIGPWLLRGLGAALGVLSGPVGWAILAVTAASLAYQFWDELVAAWDVVAAQAGPLFAQSAAWFGSIDWFGQAAALVDQFWEGLNVMWSWLMGQVGPLFASLITTLTGIDWSSTGKDIGKTLMSAWLDVIEAEITLIADAFRSVDWDGLAQGIVTVITEVDWGSVGQTIIDSISAVFKNSLALWLGIFGGMAVAVGAKIKEWFDIDLGEIGAKMGSDLLDGLKKVGGQISEWWKSLFSFMPSLPGLQAVTPMPSKDSWINGENAFENYQGNQARLSAASSGAAVVTDNSFQTSSQTNNVTINQSVTQATDAPAAAARATAGAVQSAVPRVSRVEGDSVN